VSCRHRHIPTGVALTLGLAAAAPSAASARSFDLIAPAATTQPQAPPPANSQARHATNTDVGAIPAQGACGVPELARDAAISSPSEAPPPPLIVSVSQSNRFAWDDAGLCGRATFARILILLGSALYLTHRLNARVTRAGIRRVNHRALVEAGTI
jgi:hypothetical protein